MSLDKKIQSVLRDRLVSAGLLLMREMQDTVAIDTGELHNSIALSNVHVDSSVSSIDVGTSNVPYASIVEDGFPDRRKLNYHRFDAIVWSGAGMNFARRSVEATKEQIGYILAGKTSINRK